MSEYEYDRLLSDDDVAAAADELDEVGFGMQDEAEQEAEWEEDAAEDGGED